MELQIGNKIITASIYDMLTRLHKDCGGRYLNYIGKEKGDTIMIQCPFHKDGQERHPSCSVYTRRDNKDIYYGTAHCFTCGKSVPFYTLVGKCLDGDDEVGKQWLVDNYGNVISYTEELLPEIVIGSKKKPTLESSKELLYTNNNSDYLLKRGISEDVIKRFKVGFNPIRQTVTFPVRNENGNYVMTTERSINNKSFYIESDKQKPVYLLNFIKEKHIDSVYVTESQINCLTLHSWGYPAIALFGTGSKNQYEILKKSGIRNYCLALDGDEAGRKGIRRFIDNMPQDVLISIALLPEGKDVNDLTCEEFLNLDFIDKSDFVYRF